VSSAKAGRERVRGDIAGGARPAPATEQAGPGVACGPRLEADANAGVHLPLLDRAWLGDPHPRPVSVSRTPRASFKGVGEKFGFQVGPRPGSSGSTGSQDIDADVHHRAVGDPKSQDKPALSKAAVACLVRAGVSCTPPERAGRLRASLAGQL